MGILPSIDVSNVLSEEKEQKNKSTRRVGWADRSDVSSRKQANKDAKGGIIEKPKFWELVELVICYDTYDVVNQVKEVTKCL